MKNKYYDAKQLKNKTYYQIKIAKHETHICGESCALYNSLGCPYIGGGNTGKYCDEWRCKNGEK